ncbi:glycosyltransferase, group 1 family protein [Leptospira inadai serovar Lyme str. 10]|uniref:starch synthase n=2 Tax=Leptospira inadai serovar Lyme TaxID=293084 RepID=V6HA72_9LEPT|nr:glycosyltransferase family 4 protein [Leptospira inadai]EQA36017.1 glycosyltransferase, group 1 family protein [Leptospira inadai serovar Lyme str. 10]PNV76978.1 glycosyltransferase family 1 protein [Leptospira inadai serovar Lyme]
MFKILMIGWEYPPKITGGLGTACYNIAKALSDSGNEIYFVLPQLSGEEPKLQNVKILDVEGTIVNFEEEERRILYKFQNESIYKALSLQAFHPYESSRDTSLQDSEPVTTKKATTLSETIRHTTGNESLKIQPGYTKNIINDIRLYARFNSLLAPKLAFDIIHCHDWMTFPAGVEAAKSTRKPLICHVHATEFDRSGERVNQQVYDLERNAFKEATAIITVSNYTKRILIERYSVPEYKIYPIHNGVEFELDRNLLKNKTADNQERLVLFLGRITFQKGPDYFVRAAKKVLEVMDNVRFVMAGTGDMYARMIEMAADLGVGKYFHYTGFLSKEETRQLYSMADLYIMPSVSEPFGLSTLEAMGGGVPVILSKQSGVGEVVNHCIKVDFWDVDDMANKIASVLSDRNLHATLRDGGLEEATKNSWSKTGRRIEEVYANVLNRT